MCIRQATLNDAEALSQLLAQVWREAYRGIFPNDFLDNLNENGWVDGFRHALVDPTVHIGVVEKDQQRVGMIAFGNARDPEFAIPFEIYALNVLPAYQQQKIGSALMQYAFNQLATKTGIYLKVAEANFSAQAFYTKHGFHNSQKSYPRQIADFSFNEWVYQC